LIMASQGIPKLDRSWPQSASLSSLDLGLQVHLQTSSITASKPIVKKRRGVYRETGVTEME